MSAVCNLAKQYAPLLGRILLSFIFIFSGYGKIGGFKGTAAFMASQGLPMSEVLLVLTILIELGGGLMILLGWRPRLAALVIFLWLIPVTLVFHKFWGGIDAAQAQNQMIQFMKNVSIAGGMLLVLGFGSGPYSLGKDECR